MSVVRHQNEDGTWNVRSAIVAHQGEDGTWVATDTTKPGLLGRGATEEHARLDLQNKDGMQRIILRKLASSSALTFGRVFDALIADGWTIKGTPSCDRRASQTDHICALLEKCGATFMVNEGRATIVSATWLDAIVAATGLDPSTIK